MDTIQKVDLRSIEFHNKRDDFSSWAKYSLKDVKLCIDLKKIREQKICGEALRAEIYNKITNRFNELKHYLEDALHLS